MEWITKQFETLNLLSILIMILFVTAMSKANNQRMLKEQSKELYAEFEELKTEIRGVGQSIINTLKK